MRRAGRLRVVFDCNTLVQAAASENSAAANCMELVKTGTIELFLSRAVLSELRRVMNYPEVRAISPNMTSERIAEFMGWLAYRGTVIKRVPAIFNYPRDPDDEPYVDLAVTCKAEYLVTRDKDLLSLMTGHTALCKDFRKRTSPLRVVKPAEFLTIAQHASE